MQHRLLAATIALIVGIAPLFAGAGGRTPLPDPAFLAKEIPSSDCTAENDYEAQYWMQGPGAYGTACKRLHFSFGPIVIKPGQNDVLITPVTIEKPAYAGSIVRFKPDMVDATGTAPPIEEVHLHHATWLNAYPNYGDGPFFAAGEEKTIASFPKGYGMQVKPTDVWLLLYMVHNATAVPRVTWITYDIDYVAAADAVALGIAKVKPLWLDVQRKAIAPGAPSTSGNPVFNVQKGFGSVDPETGLQVCTWPKQNCARHDVYGGVTPQQGVALSGLAGADWTVRSDMAGTIIGLGGHLHPGGIRDEVSLVRDGNEKLIHISDAVYWDPQNPAQGGGPANSWDFSMTATGAPLGWKVKIKPGDTLRLNAVYDSQYSSWYENMGIVVALVAVDDPHAPAGVDVFDDAVTIDRGTPDGVTVPANHGFGTWDAATDRCTPDLVGPVKTLCARGSVTHGHMDEATTRGGRNAAPITAPDGPLVNEIHMAGFTYGQADMAVVGVSGIPRVKVGQPVRFWNVDTAADIWHTVTRCAAPCTGSTGLDYPLANGSSGATDPMEFDSTELGYGVFFSPASGQIGGSKPLEEAIQDGLYWDFTPAQTGVFPFWCRIHPSMRGVFKVIE